MSEAYKTIPALALRGVSIFPEMIVEFDVTRKLSAEALEEALRRDRRIFLVLQRKTDIEKPTQDDLYSVGVIAEIKQVLRLQQPGSLRALVEGIEKAQLVRLCQEAPYLLAEISPYEYEVQTFPKDEERAMRESLRRLFVQFSRENGKLDKKQEASLLAIEELEKFMHDLCMHLFTTYQNRQRLLEASSTEELFETLGVILSMEIEVQKISGDIKKKLKEKLDKNQREYVLREQLKVIRKELGEDDILDEAQEYRSRLEKIAAPAEIKEKINREIDRFKSIGGHSAESTVERGYIETLLELPWEAHSQDSEDLKKAWKILQEGHYGLREVKERIMEFLSVRTLTHKGKSPILCLVGPPGTGKTSIAKSVAEALDKKYVRICLGGVRDEAEIRGHRKTYVGAMPGRITSALLQAGVSNPLLLLDEIDKTGSDYKGDTASALLEVLDPEQNSRFTDHYVELPQDLSEVLFIATANDIQQIPRPLLDRMEVLEIPGYTENEKEHIAKEHLIPKQMQINGIQKEWLSIQGGALRKIINNYTKEAGVRSLERCIGRICRKTAREITEQGKKKINITSKNLSSYLGKEKYDYLMANKKDEIGIARGLAWTQAGGDTLQIEVNVMPGKGELLLTGQLGDVMKESAQAGISYIRSVAGNYGIAPEFFRENDIHVHIPEGAVPKDGPSAGITMATAILSAVIRVPVRADVAMTGEITLRGRVLPIGGLKEKLLAARYAKIKEVLVPKSNKEDVLEMDGEITENLEITYVETMEDVLKRALTEKKKGK